MNHIWHLADEHLTESELLELLARKQKKKAPKKLSQYQMDVNEIEEELLKKMK